MFSSYIINKKLKIAIFYNVVNSPPAELSQQLAA